MKVSMYKSLDIYTCGILGVFGCGKGKEKYTLDFGLDIVDGVGRFDLEGDGFTREGFDEDLHAGLEGDGASGQCWPC